MNYPSIIGCILSVLGIVLLLIFKTKIHNPYLKCLWRSSLTFFVLYILILTTVALRWNYLENQILAYDLNSNGNMEWNEYTEEYKIASQRFISDTARNFAFLTGAVFSLIISSLILLVDLIQTRLKLKKILFKK
ncbi:hypothetical protein GGR42_003272 [Saonia flava]|uniref:Uncharacterized protein n=1 Tax=Saonia flava TaxID=523696 RepID=A0A846QWR1_9FLAO|nr:hypothetical protein [Saonia flava]NJB72781.1 hypothetical protein [Saonia flava]